MLFTGKENALGVRLHNKQQKIVSNCLDVLFISKVIIVFLYKLKIFLPMIFNVSKLNKFYQLKPMMQRTIYLFILSVSLLFVQNSFAQNEFKVKKVVIDAGHGGHDGGCHGSFSNEKDVALAIALKLGEYIESNFPDVEVIYTRKTDVFVPLFERAQIANKANADLFICIHVNSGQPSAYGTETYVMGLHKTESNLKVAQRENSVILYEDDYKNKYENFDPNSPESYIALTLMQNAYLAQSIDFANKIQTQFRERVGRKDRGVRQAGFLVLHQTAMPSVLIETGFLTNKDEEKFLNSKIGQDYMASAIYRAFKEYKYGIESKMNNTKEANESVTSDNQNVEETSSQTVQTANSNQIIFKVQIATSPKKVDTLPQNFKGLEGVTYTEQGGLFRYYVGNENSFENAVNLQKKVRDLGYKDAFIVAFENDERIAVSEAVNKLKKQ
jgi:N-acetylmuramoyl-L-alanine amidase